MSKSTGNNILPNEIFSLGSPFLTKTFSESSVKFFMLQAHYRNVLDISNDALVASERGFQRIKDAIDNLNNFNTFSKKTSFNVKNWISDCYDAMNDDFNTPILISHIFEVVKFINKLNIGQANITKADYNKLQNTIKLFMTDIMGLDIANKSSFKNDKFDQIINVLLELRKDARKNKDYKMSDRIRDMLKEKGISINDSDDNSSYTID